MTVFKVGYWAEAGLTKPDRFVRNADTAFAKQTIDYP